VTHDSFLLIIKMKWNMAEMSSLLNQRSPDWEGKLLYRPPKSSGSFGMEPIFKERYFKLLGNMLFCLRTSPEGKYDSTSEPVQVLVMEQFSMELEDRQGCHCFAITFRGEDSNNKHVFIAGSHRTVTQWTEALHNCSYDLKRETLILLQIKLRNRSGVDPLRGTAFEYNPCYFLENKPAKDPTLLRDPGTPPQRKRNWSNKTGGSGKSGFTSHIGIENWERFDKEDSQKNQGQISSTVPTFLSHIDMKDSNSETKQENLIEF